jgi:hypothetical protein
MRFITRTLATITLGLTALALSGTAHAEDGCQVVDYQGAPATICSPPDPGPICWDGWYQGAPVEVCGDQLPEGTTYHDATPWAGEPIVAHPSTSDAPPVAPVPPAPVVERSPLAVIVTLGHYFHKAGS